MNDKKDSPVSAAKHQIAYRLAHAIMIGVPLIAGIDKYFNFITDWERYVSPALKPLIPMSSKNAMRCAGLAEIAVGLTVATRPRLGSVALAGMLGGIILNLLTMKKQLHIASLDFCLACFALVFAMLLPEAKKP